MTISNTQNKQEFIIIHEPVSQYITTNNTSSHSYQHKLHTIDDSYTQHFPLSINKFNRRFKIFKQLAFEHG